MSTSGELNDADSGNTLIDISGLDPTTDAGKQAIADAIYAKISAGLGTDFESTAPTVAAGDTSVSLSFVAKNAGTASNKGEIQVYDNPKAIEGTYTAGTDAPNSDILVSKHGRGLFQKA